MTTARSPLQITLMSDDKLEKTRCLNPSNPSVKVPLLFERCRRGNGKTRAFAVIVDTCDVLNAIRRALPTDSRNVVREGYDMRHYNDAVDRRIERDDREETGG